MAWSIPEGYEVLPERASGATVIVAARHREAMLSVGLDDPEVLASPTAVAGWLEGGRVRHPVIAAPGDLWVVKAYRRGGLVARWNLDRYWWHRRFLRELETAVGALHAGVPAPEPVALVLEPAGLLGSFRAWQVVRFLEGVRSLREVLRESPAADGEAPELLGPIFRAAGEAVRRMHVAGIDHPDLNLGNILARPGPGTPPDPSGAPIASAYIVDWDRARLRPAGSWNPHRNLLRLWRSVLKLARRSPSAGGRVPASLRAFLRGYFGRDRKGLRSLRGYARPRIAILAIRAVFWDLARAGRAG